MRYVGLDVGRDFARIGVVEEKGTPDAGGPDGDPFREFAATLCSEDVVALEASTNTRTLTELAGRHAG